MVRTVCLALLSISAVAAGESNAPDGKLSAGAGTATSRGVAATIRHNYDLKNVLWKLTIDPSSHSVRGDATNTLVLSEDASTVQLHCMNIDVTTVTVDGAAAKFDTNNDLLTVQLPQPAHAAQSLQVRAVYKAQPRRGIYFVDAQHAFPSKTGMVYTQGEGEDNRNWLPTYDLPDDKATAECFITVPKSWTAISNGKLEDTSDQGDQKVFHWKMDQPFSTYLISFVAGEYVEGKGSWNQTPVNYYVPPGLEAQGKLSFGSTPRMIDLYSRLTGVPYPYAKFSQEVVGDFVVGGMENITAVTQMIRTLHVANSEPLNDSTGLVAHELAHQWFGDLVTCRTWEHMWLNEGFATTMPLFLDRDWYGQDRFDYDRYSNFEGAIDSIGSRNRNDVPGTVGSVEEVTMGSPYPGGASRILMLMHRLGERTFWKGIHAYLKKHAFQPVTTTEFFSDMSEASHQDLSEFESQWYHTSATPSLSVSTEGTYLVIHQLAPYYKLDLPVWFLSNGSWTKKQVHVEGQESRLELGGLASQPYLLDPECWTLMELRYTGVLSPEAVAALYKSAPNAASRARIVAEMFDRLSVPQRIELAKWEKVSSLVTMICPRLGSEGESYLAELLGNDDIKIVDAAVQALGSIPQSGSTVARLQRIASNHPNEALREHAWRSLLSRSSDEALAEKVWVLPAFDDGFQVIAMDWWAKNAPGIARNRALDVLSGRSDDPVRIAACNALGVVKGGEKEREVFDALVKVATDNSYRLKISAIRALGALGDPAAIPVLKGTSPFDPGGVQGAAGAALKQLGA